MEIEPNNIIRGDRYAESLMQELEERARKDPLPKRMPILRDAGPRPKTILDSVDSVMGQAMVSIDQVHNAISTLSDRTSALKNNQEPIKASQYESVEIESQLIEQDLAGALLELQQAQALSRRRPLRFDFRLSRILDGYEEKTSKEKK